MRNDLNMINTIVQIWHHKDNNDFYIGTGFFIYPSNSPMWILSCSHFFRNIEFNNEREYFFIKWRGQKRFIKNRYFNTDAKINEDIALLQINNKFNKGANSLSLSFSVSAFFASVNNCFCSGYYEKELSELTFITLKHRTINHEQEYIIFDNINQKGLSGSPIIRKNDSKVMGVVSCRTEDKLLIGISLYNITKLLKSKNINLLQNIIKINTNNKTKRNVNSQVLDKVLFSIYSNEREKFYLERSVDIEIKKALSHYNIWIHGPTGYGKTSCIARNLLVNNKIFKYISLGTCKENSILHIFYEIYLNLYKSLNKNYPKKNNQLNIIQLKDYILKMLCQLNNQNQYIYLDELPLSNQQGFNDFLNNIISIIIECSKKKDLYNHLLFSTMESPIKYIKDYQLKIKEHIFFKELLKWNNIEIKLLLKMLCGQLNINFSNKEIDYIVSQAVGSPRYIKVFLKKYTLFSKQKNLSEILSEIGRDCMV